MYINSKKWCFEHLGTSKRKVIKVPGLALIISTIVIASSLWGKFDSKEGKHLAELEGSRVIPIFPVNNS